jgi:formylglycine-generating enzyme required for sulfatase activity
MEGLTPVYQVNGFLYRSGEYGASGSNVVMQVVGANGYRLPSEKEWEWAARGGLKSATTVTMTMTSEGEWAARGGLKSRGYKYSGSDDLSAVGWYSENSNQVTHKVGRKVGNEIGVYDMSGNVWEWCWDLEGSYRRICGGSWYSSANSCAVSSRDHDNTPDDRNETFGLRLARSSEF